MANILNIAEEFSATPGARLREDGRASGQQFFEELLRPRFIEAMQENDNLVILLDGTHGYATSFLDEAFGRLAQEFGVNKVKNILSFISEEEPYLIDEINEYIEDAHQA